MRWIYDLDQRELAEVLAAWGEPPYRARQIWQGLYRQLYTSPDQFTTLPASLRTRLAQEFQCTPLVPVKRLESADQQTVKTLLRLNDGLLIEAVLMRYGDAADSPASGSGREEKRRRTLCISTQVGCAMGCTFCATGQMGFKRHLTAGEIVAQVLYYAPGLRERKETITNVVLMGMGEPLHNYENVMAAVDRLNDPDGYHFAARRITLSTVGLVPEIRRLADSGRQVNLAVSLHALDDKARQSIMPVARRYRVEQILQACRYYVEKTHRRVTFEWALIRDFNDTPAIARQLAQRLSGLLCHVNIIPLNPTDGYSGKASTRKRALAFKETLEQAGIPCTIRVRRGIEIRAGCGQLAGSGVMPSYSRTVR